MAEVSARVKLAELMRIEYFTIRNASPRLFRAVVVLAFLALAACGKPQPSVDEPLPLAVSDNPAVTSLVAQARGDFDAARYPSASAQLERALRIEPRNPWLWHELAQVRLRQGDFAQAEGLAARSNGYARDQRHLQQANWRLIAEARTRAGDNAGAAAARAKAEALDR
jgi:predicted Zn-dependent protease